MWMIFRMAAQRGKPGRYRLAAPHASLNFGSKGLPDLRMAKAMWTSLRMAAQATALPFLPAALRRWQRGKAQSYGAIAKRIAPHDEV
jgi:hypothetical protein